MAPTHEVTTMKDRNLADVLWNRYRAWADVTVSYCEPEVNREEAREKAYQWIVRHIATWLDRIEREPNFEKRTQLITHLVYGPLPEPGSIYFDQVGTDPVAEEIPTSHETHPKLVAQGSMFDAPPETDRKTSCSPFGYGTGWSEFCL
jgi:hypothetical protein